MQIKLISNENGVSEWIMIEMQGNFEFDSDVSGKLVGHFAWRKDSTACFIVGHQLLEGKLSNLERPFLVIDKTLCRNVRPESSQVSIKECDIVGVIRRKIVFKDRPKPIITHGTTIN